MRRIHSLFTFFIFLTLCTLEVGATEFTVCANGCDFTKIQDAIDASSSGDTILIGEGIYNDEYSELVLTKSLVIKNQPSWRLIVRTGGGILNKGIVDIDDASIISLNTPDNCAGCE